PLGLARLAERIARQDPRTVRDTAGGGECLFTADRDTPQPAIDGIRGSEWRYRQVALLQVFQFLLTLEGAVAHRSNDFQLRRERAQRHFETYLVITGGRAAVGNRVGAELARHVRDGLRLHGTLGADTERIQLAALDVSHDEKAQHLLEIIRTSIDLVMLDVAERASALTKRTSGSSIDATGVDGHCNYGTAVIFRDPGNEERGVEPTGIGKDNGLGARAGGRVRHDDLDSEDGVQTAHQLVLRACVGGCNENGVVAGDRSGHFGPLGLVDRDGDALSRADRRTQHSNGGTGALQAAHELRQSTEVPVGSRELVR